MKAKLVLILPDAEVKEFKLALPTKIGRGQEAKLKLVHPLVSRVHCEIYEQGEQLMVRDMASLNGTFVDDQRVADEMALPSGCRLTVGSANFHVLYGADYDRPLPVRAAAKSGELTKTADETIPMPSAPKSSAKSKSGSKEPEESWTPANSDSHASEAEEDTRTIDFDFLSENESPETEPAPPAKVSAPAKPAAKPMAAARPAAAAKPGPAAKPAAAKPSAAAKPAVSVRPPNPAELADEDDELNSPKPFTATGRPPAKSAPATPAPAAPADGSDKMVVGPVEQSSDEGGDPDLDDFLKSIM